MPEQQERPRPHGDPLEAEVGRHIEEGEGTDAPAEHDEAGAETEHARRERPGDSGRAPERR